MEIFIKQTDSRSYKELVLKDTNVIIETGLMNLEEAKELALIFMRAACELLED